MKGKVLLCFFLLVGSVWAQVSGTRAAELATSLGQSADFPVNVRLRFQILASQMGLVEGKQAKDLFDFFSTTRLMAWDNPLQAPTQQSLEQLEQQMQGLASQKGKSLNLPPTGRTAAGLRLVSNEQMTSSGLSNLVLQTEQIATELLATNSSAELLFLRDNLTRLRTDLADGRFAADAIRSVLGARVRLLAAQASALRDPRLQNQLDVLGEALRGMFPADVLRAAAGQELRL